MFCPNCGKEMNEENSICQSCGYGTEKNKSIFSKIKRHKVLIFVVAEIVVLGVIYAILTLNSSGSNSDLKFENFQEEIYMDLNGDIEYKFYGISVESIGMYSEDDSVGATLEFDKSDASDVKKVIKKYCKKIEEKEAGIWGEQTVYSYDDNMEIRVFNDDFTSILIDFEK